jgi:magnesium-protoporphyrin IX monomethyl ester (oxidative) cyclase
MNGKKLRKRPYETIIEEIDTLYEDFAVRGFSIIDDNFTLDIEWCKGLLRRIIDRDYKDARFATPNGVRVEHLDAELLQLMRKAKWQDVIFAPESGSRKTLKRMHKTIKLGEIPRKVQMVRDAGLECSAFMMMGFPGETVGDIWESIVFAVRARFDRVFFSIYQPLPGTLTYNDLVDNKEIPPDFSTYAFNKINYVPQTLSAAKIRVMYIMAYLFCNARPEQLYHLAKKFGIMALIRFSWNRALGRE